MITPKSSDELNLLSSSLLFLTTLNNGLENILGTAAKGVILNAGLVEGRFIAKNFPRTKFIEKAIDIVNNAFKGVWDVELFKPKDKDDYFYTNDNGLPSVNVIIRNCPIRQAVLTYNLKQGEPLCYLTNGYLIGMISEITGLRVGLDMLHHGPNACLKQLYHRKR